MSADILSLVALFAVVAVGCLSPPSVGFLSIALSFLVGHFAAEMTLSEIIHGFPSRLFLTLTGVTLLFAQARSNGTLEKIVLHCVRWTRGSRGSMPIVFFVLGAGLAAVGAGNFAATALLAPVAMTLASERGVSSFLMAIMLIHGATAGAFSPIAPTGIVARDLMRRVGLRGKVWPNFFNTFAAQSLVACLGFTFLGGVKALRDGPGHRVQQQVRDSVPHEDTAMRPRQFLTMVVLGLLLLSVAAFRIDVGMAAFVAAAILSILRAADDGAAVKSMPWEAILMICGVTLLMEILNKTGGTDLFTQFLAELSGPTYVTGAIALITGAISAYSSSIGVVLPAFLPLIPGLIARVGGGNPLMVAYSINVGSHLVDASPLSPLGALCLASASPRGDRASLFRRLLAWGCSMILVGALVCQLFFGYR